ncbi:MAG: ribbon-helix-helix protein, CopG family [Candidatus Humimicrobiaceae bacterium]|jgi:metal-responsive CopG/Arc/MetJ family transcriptional regulator|nr:ribbon-helix-helix protein, CopG family [Actinomycetota bacterium]MDD5600332.1 ribbon-helix-helix protein, CopG family [Actinomycetota bacterium]MDY0028221.1 ribbon-helix-helix protein, CopG family [Candidatus Humimicrobiaceae bacterium]
MVRINLSIEEKELEQIDKISKSENISRSKLIRKALEVYMGEIERKAAENIRRQNIEKAIEVQENLRKYSRGWDGVSEIRKWRESR